MAGVITIRVSSNANEIARGLDDFIRRQLPFAIAQGVNLTANRVAGDETENIVKTFKNPSPFTRKAVGIKRAKKGSPTAVVFMKDATAAYLQPYETGGAHRLAGTALLNPKDINLNQYGQLPRGIMAKLRGRKDIYIGVIQTAKGSINGVWQRLDVTNKGTTRRKRVERGSVHDKHLGALKLLIRFGDALPVKQQLNWGKKAKQTVDQWIDRDLSTALAAARRTAR
ncbi:hypothetical protein LMG24238_06909 [Paraburkholderia sediminicola]|uniref:Uncharacterized protein n=1 Tax=Paraburkholderia sediminicola TaxID=458836 RepID=A0A6J5CRS8_9BURK|nr:hypothetical protein [Paraburkholderia sediminicola]CAB3742608.1 hypothetical protein LMG24238_06909 [Paraburkholderia sediminicola]